ncbi:MAG: septum formation initiator family protein [Oscillospiraceae bacterium]|nr:septum formation initiator family protein [Oscillospiraceae bacterium]MBR2927974.1 septum formation initiator family protein [Oscillospiraceae bacterium]MBR6677243.1 septum formation initiator family protein [Oscillospiraceae bacterium]
MARENKKRRSSLPTLLALGVLVVLVWQLLTLGGRISDAKAQVDALSEEVQALTMANETLSDEIAHASDKDLIMDIARSELGLVEPGEKVFYDQNY